MGARIHPTAIVDRRADLAPDVEIGAYSVIEAHVAIGAGTRIGPHVVVCERTTLGRGNEAHSFAVIGAPPQVRKRDGEGAGALVIGDFNVFREHVTVHRGSLALPTRIGSHNLLMVGCHIAHDVQIGSHVTIANQAQLAGHCLVEDHATFGGLAGLAQFVRVGQSAFVVAGAMCEADVPPFAIVQGDRARVRALNKVGLKRRGISAESVAALQRAFHALFRGNIPRAQALREIPRDDPNVAALLAFLAAPPRRSPRRG